MKFLLSVLLLNSVLFSKVKTGTNLHCYQTVPESLCKREILDLYNSVYGFGGNKDQLESDALSCLKSKHNEEYKYCDYYSSVCSKLSVKFKDGNQTFLTYCDFMAHGQTLLLCDSMKDDINLKGLADAKCDYCSISGCNSSPSGTSQLLKNGSSSQAPEQLSCLQTDFQDLCIPETLQVRQATKLGNYNVHQYISNALNCYKRPKQENFELCEKEKTQCSRLTLKFYDGTQTSAAVCDTKGNTTCEYYKEKAKKYFTYGISSAQCDYCIGDSCNNVEELAEPAEDVSNSPDIFCFETVLDYMCESELTNWQKNRGENSHLESDALNCLKRQNNIVHPNLCKSPYSMCAKLSLKFKDGTETEFRFCDSSGTCFLYKNYLNDELKDELVNAQCDHCSQNFCNSNLEKTIFRNPKLEEPEKTKLRCYHSDFVSCKGKNILNEFYAIVSCASRAEVKEKEDCNLCMTEIYTNSDNQKLEISICGKKELSKTCINGTTMNMIIQSLSGDKLKSVICIPCKYDLCNGLQKQELEKNEEGNQTESNDLDQDSEKRKITRSEARNQVMLNPTIITFVSLLVCLMF